MTNYADAKTALRDFFDTQWNDATAIIWGKDDAQKPPEENSWVRFNINHSDGRQASIGSPSANRFRHVGIITLQIFSKEGNYGISTETLASSALEIYQGAEAGGIHYYNARADEVGNDGFGWHQINVVVEFRYDNIT